MRTRTIRSHDGCRCRGYHLLLALACLCLVTLWLAACDSAGGGNETTAGTTLPPSTPVDTEELSAVPGDETASPTQTTPSNGDTAKPTDGESAPTIEPDTLAAESEPETTAPNDDGIITLPPAPVVPEPTAAEMPRLDITTEGGQSVDSKDYYVRSTVTLSNCHENYAFTDAPAGIRVRGNSTAAAPKKPYRLKFDEKQGMLGLTGNREFRSWCLMADYFDGSMLRTFGTFKFAKALMKGEYFSADCTHVEIYLNGQYQGVYLLCDQTQMNKGRINIPEKEDGDTSVEHGYLLIGQGGRTDEPESIVVRPEITVIDRNGDTMYFGGLNFALSGSDYTEEQKAYVAKYCSGVFKVVAKAVYDNEYYMLSRNGSLRRKTKFDWAKTDEEKQIETISAVFNIESAVSMCILDEIVKNLDAMTFNMYVDLSPDGDGVLTLAAPWDFDFSMANTHYDSTHDYEGFYATNLSYSEGMRTNLWYVMLGSIDWFEDMCREKWKEAYPELKAVIAEMESVNIAYDAAFNRDYDRWGLPMDRSLIHHHDQKDLRKFKEHSTAGKFVTDWLKLRLWWLDTQWGEGLDEKPVIESNKPAVPAPPAPALELTFNSETSLSYIDKAKRCTVDLIQGALRLRPSEEAYDPYFSFDYSLLSDEYQAEDYYILEFTYRIPSRASADVYTTQLFLCAGDVNAPEEQSSVRVETYADDKWHTVRIDLLDEGCWEGTIHEIRMDFFSSCEAADAMYLKDFKLLPQ